MYNLYRHTTFLMIALMAVTIIGFWPSFFSRMGDAEFTQIFHGITSTLWIVLLGVQAWLINAQKTAIHRSLGIAGLALAPLVLAGFAMINLDSANRTALGNSMFSQLFSAPLMIFDLLFLPLTLGLIYLGLKHRKNIRHHAAFMVLTCFALIGPSMSRLLVNFVPGFTVTGPDTIHNFGHSLWFSMLLTMVCIAVIAIKTRVERKVWLWGLNIYIVAFLLYLTLGQSAFWKDIVVAISQLQYATVFSIALLISSAFIWLGWVQGKAVKKQRETLSPSPNP